MAAFLDDISLGPFPKVKCISKLGGVGSKLTFELANLNQKILLYPKYIMEASEGTGNEIASHCSSFTLVVVRMPLLGDPTTMQALIAQL